MPAFTRSIQARSIASGRQVRVREIAVVLRVFLAAHRARLVAVRIPEARLLHDGTAVLDQRDLAAHLEVDRLLHEAEAVQVLDLAAGAERLARAAHRHVRVAAEAAFLHVAVADADPADERVQRLRVGDRLVRAAQVRLGHDLEQRRAGAVEVDAGHAVEVLVQALARVLLEVRAREVHADRRRASATRCRRRRPARRGSRTARSGSPSAGPGRSSSCARTRSAARSSRRRRGRSGSRARPRRLFSTGSTPGSAMSTADACVFGAAPNAVDAPEKIFDAVDSCAWVSSPMTTSQFMRASCPWVGLQPTLPDLG